MSRTATKIQDEFWAAGDSEEPAKKVGAAATLTDETSSPAWGNSEQCGKQCIDLVYDAALTKENVQNEGDALDYWYADEELVAPVMRQECDVRRRRETRAKKKTSELEDEIREDL